MKYEWKKAEKDIYLPKQSPVLITVPKYKFFMVEGEGDPNKKEFSENIGALYTLSYTIRMMPKSGFTPHGYFEYTVYPLEAVWDSHEVPLEDMLLNKDAFIYKAMIRQPDFVTQELFETALASASKKVDASILKKVQFVEIEDGLSVQTMHIGPYDDEPATFAEMDTFLKESNLQKRLHTHREIYMGDPRKAAPEKLRTVLRVFVEPA